jgi:pimeloyl-ACP methyl ester carboxylesterase
MSTTDVRTEAPTEATATYVAAATQFIDAGDLRFAVRRFGARGARPLVMFQHFRGNLDNWDPALTNALAMEREVILVDYPGSDHRAARSIQASAMRPGRWSDSSTLWVSARLTSSVSRSADSSRRRSR